MAYDLATTWAGIGIKVDGMIIAGADSFEGAAIRLDSSPSASITGVNVSSIRFGLGVGGSIGTSLFLAFNTPTLTWLNGQELDRDWGIAFAVPGVKVTLGNALSQAWKVLKTLKKGSDLLRVSPEQIEKLRDVAAKVWAAREGGAVAASNKSTALVLDIPEAGWGAEISAYLAWGKVMTGGKA